MKRTCETLNLFLCHGEQFHTSAIVNGAKGSCMLVEQNHCEVVSRDLQDRSGGDRRLGRRGDRRK